MATIESGHGHRGTESAIRRKPGRVLPQGLESEVERLTAWKRPAAIFPPPRMSRVNWEVLTGKRLVVPAFFFSSATRTQFIADEKRESAIDMKFAEQVIDDVMYHLPAGFTIQSAPAPAQLPWPERAALVVKTQISPGTIDIKHIFARAFVLLDSKEYPALCDFYQKLAASDQQPLVLTNGTAQPATEDVVTRCKLPS